MILTIYGIVLGALIGWAIAGGAGLIIGGALGFFFGSFLAGMCTMSARADDYRLRR